MHNILAIIPARGGSKGVPRKNIKDLCGKPLIAWTIEEALKSKFISRSIVSTEDAEIAEIAKRYGADVPFLRPEKLAQDHSTDIEFIVHALDFLKQREEYEPDIILRLPPTSPLRTVEYIDRGIEVIVNNKEFDCVRAIAESQKHPYKAWRISDDKKYIEPFFSKLVTGFEHPYDQPRQIMPDVYIHGALDIIRRETIRRYNSVHGKKAGYILLPPEMCIDIDSLLDFKLAELYLKERENIN